MLSPSGNRISSTDMSDDGIARDVDSRASSPANDIELDAERGGGDGDGTLPFPMEDDVSDTVGAVAIDCWGNIAAGSSSGGIGMKHRGRMGPAALVGIGTAVHPVRPNDKSRTTVACVTSGTGEHMATTTAASTCAERVYANQKMSNAGSLTSAYEDEAVRSFIVGDFMGHPSIRNSHSQGAIGVMVVKKTTDGVYLYFGHNTESFALASMSSEDANPVSVMSRISSSDKACATGGRGLKHTPQKESRKRKPPPQQSEARSEAKKPKTPSTSDLLGKSTDGNSGLRAPLAIPNLDGNSEDPLTEAVGSMTVPSQQQSSSQIPRLNDELSSLNDVPRQEPTAPGALSPSQKFLYGGPVTSSEWSLVETISKEGKVLGSAEVSRMRTALEPKLNHDASESLPLLAYRKPTSPSSNSRHSSSKRYRQSPGVIVAVHRTRIAKHQMRVERWSQAVENRAIMFRHASEVVQAIDQRILRDKVPSRLPRFGHLPSPQREDTSAFKEYAVSRSLLTILEGHRSLERSRLARAKARLVLARAQGRWGLSLGARVAEAQALRVEARQHWYDARHKVRWARIVLELPPRSVSQETQAYALGLLRRERRKRPGWRLRSRAELRKALHCVQTVRVV